ncbi:hypothetical protein [Neolewinella xylanilytica]|uniref:hypothetical protein n=1 Tax=Neolewinella xylanilytica TaxID=1514080 RepID=UPI0011B02AE4|nr:hypothetical protein [Neolewinella xylanilytica]
MRPQVRSLIIDYLNDQISAEHTLRQIMDLTGKHISEYELNNYWRSEDLESFIDRLALQSLDPKTIDDDRAIELLQSILDNLGDHALLIRNSEALEIKYRKPSGTVVNLIFYKEIEDVSSLLLALKIDTVTYL